MAELTITVPDPQVPRVQAALGNVLSLVDGNGDRRDATAEEARQFLVDELKNIVAAHERAVAASVATGAVVAIDAT